MDYQTVLHLSSRLGHWKLTALFCSEEIDADPNVTDIKNFTPLHYACLAGNTKDSRILLNTGANVILQNYVSTWIPIFFKSFNDMETFYPWMELYFNLHLFLSVWWLPNTYGNTIWQRENIALSTWVKICLSTEKQEETTKQNR